VLTRVLATVRMMLPETNSLATSRLYLKAVFLYKKTDTTELLSNNTENSKNNNKAQIEKSNIFGQVPYGYENSNGKIIKNIGEFELLKTVHILHKQGYSLRKICEYLSGKGIQTKNNKNWHANTIKKILMHNYNNKYILNQLS